MGQCKICGRDNTHAIGMTVTKWKGDGDPPEGWKDDPEKQPHFCNPEEHQRFTKTIFAAVKRG